MALGADKNRFCIGGMSMAVKIIINYTVTFK